MKLHFQQVVFRVAFADCEQQGGNAADGEADDSGRVGHDEFGSHDGKIAFAETCEGGAHWDERTDEAACGTETKGEAVFVQTVAEALAMDLEKMLNVRIIMRL